MDGTTDNNLAEFSQLRIQGEEMTQAGINTFPGAITYYPYEGSAVTIPPEPDRIYSSEWNNQVIEVIVYSKPLQGFDPSDRIRLRIHTQNTREVTMNIEDAISIIHGLSKAVELALAEDHPIRPAEQG